MKKTLKAECILWQNSENLKCLYCNNIFKNHEDRKIKCACFSMRDRTFINRTSKCPCVICMALTRGRNRIKNKIPNQPNVSQE